MVLGKFFGNKEGDSLESLQERNEKLKVQAENSDLQLSIEQKKYLMDKLKQNGMSVQKDFGGLIKRAWHWAINN